MPNNNSYEYYGGGGYGQQQQQPQQGEQDQVNDLSSNALLLKELLENQKNASPTNIHKFLRL
jgi:hypothetical protein